ncbi:hypothetical protein AGLY_014171 [Aphis glycines]|uniref:Uncharacterized protein n=1 Tax=Aphis glycines TaxID=307491 RepID=A0A6G0T4B3_APHGL|nr:hypothetical protein AGLY_014171 [Aphis glycines]
MLKGRYSNNLETHIRCCHVEEYKVLQRIKKENTIKEKHPPNDNSTTALPPLKEDIYIKHGMMDSILIKKSLNIKLDKTTLLKACTELVTVNGHPFTIFSDSGFKKILNPLTEAIGAGFAINPHNIKSHILSTAIITTEIKSDITNQLISLKIDCVKRHSRSIMGVNVQYIKDNKLCFYTIGMVEVNEQHTAENLKKLLLEILETCNAANMVKLARIVNEIPEMCVMTENELDGDNNDSFDDDQSDIYINEGEPLSCIDIENELRNCKQPMNDGITMNIENVESNVCNSLSPVAITSCVWCSVHTLQLCILQGFKVAPIMNSISRARHVVKTLRNPVGWQGIKNILSKVEALKPIKITTLALQKQDLNLGDFFGIW